MLDKYKKDCFKAYKRSTFSFEDDPQGYNDVCLYEYRDKKRILLGYISNEGGWHWDTVLGPSNKHHESSEDMCIARLLEALEIRIEI